jgi:hypothetical protein
MRSVASASSASAMASATSFHANGRPHLDSDPLNLMIMTDASTCDPIRRLLQTAAQYAHGTAHHTIHHGQSRLEINARLSHMRQSSSLATLLTVRSEETLGRIDGKNLAQYLFPAHTPSSGVGASGGRGGRGGGRGGRGRGGRGGRSSNRPLSNEMIYLVSREEMRPDRPKDEIRQTWLHTAMGKEFRPPAYQSQPMTPTFADADQFLFPHFDLLSHLDAAGMATAVASKNDPRKLISFFLLSQTSSGSKPEKYDEIVTSYGAEIQHECVQQMMEVFNSPTRMRRYIKAAQAIKVTISEDARSVRTRFFRRHELS